MDGKLRTAKKRMEDYLHDYDALFEKTQKLHDELNDQMRGNQLISTELSEREDEIGRKRLEVEEAKVQDKRVRKLRDVTQRKIEKVDRTMEKYEAEHETLQNEQKLKQADIETEQRDGERLKKSRDELIRVREALDKVLVQDF